MPQHLLIVEDDPALQQMLAWELEDLGYAVSCAGTCRQGRAFMSQQVFDLALLDCELPDGTCVQLIDALWEQNPHLPIVLSSGRACPEELRQAVGEGLIQFAAKPVSSTQLHELFQQALDASQNA